MIGETLYRGTLHHDGSELVLLYVRSFETDVWRWRSGSHAVERDRVALDVLAAACRWLCRPRVASPFAAWMPAEVEGGWFGVDRKGPRMTLSDACKALDRMRAHGMLRELYREQGGTESEADRRFDWMLLMLRKLDAALALVDSSVPAPGWPAWPMALTPEDREGDWRGYP
jgi:hypothetical protein